MTIADEMSALRKEMGGLAMPVVLEKTVMEEVSAPSVVKPIISEKNTDVEKSPEERFLEILNTLPIGELALKLSKIKSVKKDLANKIETARRQKPFESLDDIKSRKIGLGDSTRKKIMERLLS
jgi:predicted nucleic acid-binding OB-fold protein